MTEFYLAGGTYQVHYDLPAAFVERYRSALHAFVVDDIPPPKCANRLNMQLQGDAVESPTVVALEVGLAAGDAGDVVLIVGPANDEQRRIVEEETRRLRR